MQIRSSRTSLHEELAWVAAIVFDSEMANKTLQKVLKTLSFTNEEVKSLSGIWTRRVAICGRRLKTEDGRTNFA